MRDPRFSWRKEDAYGKWMRGLAGRMRALEETRHGLRERLTRLGEPAPPALVEQSWRLGWKKGQLRWNPLTRIPQLEREIAAMKEQLTRRLGPGDTEHPELGERIGGNEEHEATK